MNFMITIAEWQIAALLAAIVSVAILTVSPQMLRTALVLIFNLALTDEISRPASESTHWGTYLCIHAISAVCILVRPAGRVQALIGVAYVIACTSDVAYGLGDIRAFSHYAQASYLDKQWWLAIIQVAVLGGWAIAGFRKHRRDRRSFADLALSHSAHHQGVE